MCHIRRCRIRLRRGDRRREAPVFGSHWSQAVVGSGRSGSSALGMLRRIRTGGPRRVLRQRDERGEGVRGRMRRRRSSGVGERVYPADTLVRVRFAVYLRHLRRPLGRELDRCWRALRMPRGHRFWGGHARLRGIQQRRCVQHLTTVFLEFPGDVGGVFSVECQAGERMGRWPYGRHVRGA